MYQNLFTWMRMFDLLINSLKESKMKQLQYIHYEVEQPCRNVSLGGFHSLREHSSEGPPVLECV